MRIQVTNIMTGILIYSEHNEELRPWRDTDPETGVSTSSFLHEDVRYFWSGRLMPEHVAKPFKKSEQYVVLNSDQVKKLWPDFELPAGNWNMVFHLAETMTKGSHVDVPAFVKGATPPQWVVEPMQYRHIWFVPKPLPKMPPNGSNLKVVD